MVTLGLLPPYTLEDVKSAYHKKVQTAHPDHGGAINEFRKIREAYELAQEHLRFRSDKRAWIASRVDAYIARDELQRQLVRSGAQVVESRIDWLEKSFGDFAEFANSIEAIELRGKPVGPAVVERIVTGHQYLSGLKRLALVDCELDDGSALRLDCFQVLAELDLSGNRLTHRVVQLAERVPTLSVMRLSRTSVGWLTRWRLARRLRKRRPASTPL